jgi:tetratricopeptide (TPR) repeat protein
VEQHAAPRAPITDQESRSVATGAARPVSEDAAGVRGLIERGEFARALALAEARLAAGEAGRELLLNAAICQRRLGRIQDALATLGRLERLQPTYTRLFQERGQCHVAERAAERAIEAFERAVQLCPALPASWKALEALYSMVGRPADARNAAAHCAKLATLPREVVTASVLFADGDLHQAETTVRRFLLAHGNHVEAMRLLARIGMQLDVLDDAELLLHGVLSIAPDYHAARYDYAIVLLRRHRHAAAEQEIVRLLAVEPDNAKYQTTRAAIAMGVGRYQQASELYADLLRRSPGDPELHLAVAHALKTLGQTDAAIARYRAAAALKPDYGEAYWSLANLKTYAFAPEELVRMREAEANPGVTPSDRAHLCFALGKALEDRREYPESFAFYARGNELKRAERSYEPEVIEANARQQAQLCTRDLLESRRAHGCQSRAPIFIVGLPRSGSTLLEQILASHSAIEGTTELSEIPRLVQSLQGRGGEGAGSEYPGVLATLRPEQLHLFGERYIENTRAYRALGRVHFIDKNPNNFRHLGLIRMILPNARIIDARRGAMACCFSNWKQLFAVGQRFTYGFEDIARYYRSYVELMQHWDEVLRGWILRVQHEEVVADLEGSVRRILDFCELEFEPTCLQFYRTERGVNTPSSEQVRQPIYRQGLDQWRHFEPWLIPLRDALGPLADA